MYINSQNSNMSAWSTKFNKSSSKFQYISGETCSNNNLSSYIIIHSCMCNYTNNRTINSFRG